MREIPVWGTIVFIECDGPDNDLLNLGIDKCAEYFREVDEVFSTYKEESQVSKLRRGEIKIEDCSDDLQEVWQLCLQAKEITDGAFDPWCVEGGFDPSGYVKGWASDKAISILRKHGATFIQVNGAGDLSLFGGPHKIGIRSPENAKVILKVFELNGGAIATSGTYERGAHIKDPHTGLIAIGARSATVVGPDGGLADGVKRLARDVERLVGVDGHTAGEFEHGDGHVAAAHLDGLCGGGGAEAFGMADADRSVVGVAGTGLPR